MNPCEPLERFLAGELSGDQRRNFESHLDDCPACQQQLALEQQLDGRLVESWTDVVAPDSLRDRLAKAASQPLPQPATLARRWAGRVLFILAASVLGWILWTVIPRPAAIPDRLVVETSPPDVSPGMDRPTTTTPPDSPPTAAHSPVVFYQGAADASIIVPGVVDSDAFTIVAALNDSASDDDSSAER